MGIIAGFIRTLLGRCPVCGGRLVMLKHDCVKGDLVECEWCERRYRVR